MIYPEFILLAIEKEKDPNRKIEMLDEVSRFIPEFQKFQQKTLDEIIGLEESVDLDNFTVIRSTRTTKQINVERAKLHVSQSDLDDCYNTPKKPELSNVKVEKLAKKLKLDPTLLFDYDEPTTSVNYKYKT
jgi:hypothetical protein